MRSRHGETRRVGVTVNKQRQRDIDKQGAQGRSDDCEFMMESSTAYCIHDECGARGAQSVCEEQALAFYSIIRQ